MGSLSFDLKASFLKVFFYGVCLTCAWSCSSAVDSRQNIILILADDFQADLIDLEGTHYLEMPAIKTLQRDGITFKNAFASAATCSPSRASILTGKYPHSASAPHITYTNNSFLYNQKTFPEILQDTGYQTAFVGKWHLGRGAKPQKGFDHYVGYDWLAPSFNPTIYINGKERKTEGFTDKVLTDQGVQFIEESTKPFMLFLSVQSPHLPFSFDPKNRDIVGSNIIEKPDNYYEDYAFSKRNPLLLNSPIRIADTAGNHLHLGSWNHYIKSYLRAAYGLNDVVGKIIAYLKEQNLYESTTIIFTSDHGYNLGTHGLTEKHFAYEEAIKVPFIIKPAKSLNPDDAGNLNKKVSEAISLLDLGPTILELVGIKPSKQMDGISLLPIIQGKDKISERPLFFQMANDNDIRIPGYTAVRTKDFKYIDYYENDYQELYDLNKDPEENFNIISNPEYQQVATSLSKELKNWEKAAEFQVRTKKRATNIYALKVEDLKKAKAKIPKSASQLNDMGYQPVKEFANQPGNYLLAIPIELRTSFDPYLVFEIPGTKEYIIGLDSQGKEIFDNKSKKPGNYLNLPVDHSDIDFVYIYIHKASPKPSLVIWGPESTYKNPKIL
jgi:arylsulfatase A-like enzyme